LNNLARLNDIVGQACPVPWNFGSGSVPLQKVQSQAPYRAGGTDLGGEGLDGVPGCVLVHGVSPCVGLWIKKRAPADAGALAVKGVCGLS